MRLGVGHPDFLPPFTSRQFAEAIAAEMIEVEDQEKRADERAGVLACVVVSAMGAKRKDGRPWESSDFYPRLKAGRSPYAGGPKTWRQARDLFSQAFGPARPPVKKGR